MRKFLHGVGVAILCLVVFGLIVTFGVLKVEAYGGDASCLFVKCVKVIK